MVSMWPFVSCRRPWVGGVVEQTATRSFRTCRALLPWLGGLRCWDPCCVFVTRTKKALLLIVSRGGPKLSVCTAFPVPLTDPPPLSTLGPSSQFDRSFLFNCSTSKWCYGPPPTPQSSGSSESRGLASWPWEVG